MKNKLLSLKFWEIVFGVALVLYLIDDLFLFSAFYITIPLTFLLGVVACVFSVKQKLYVHTIVCIIAMFLPLCRFMMTPW